MHEEMIEQIAENRGYDRGFTAGTKHAHDLLTNYENWIKDYIKTLEQFEDEPDDCLREIACYKTQLGALEYAKMVIRRGHWDDDTETPPT
jgi:hypothetical protein